MRPNEVQHGGIAVWSLLWHPVERDRIVENLAFGFDFLPNLFQLKVRLDIQHWVYVLQEGIPIKIRVED